MKKSSNILESINSQYFWDVNFHKLDPINSKRLIIERVFTLGTSKEIALVMAFYGKNSVLSVLRNLKYLDPKTLNFAALFFNVPLHSFKCYTRKQSTAQHWNS